MARYKNKLVREAEEKKQARKEAMKAKTKKNNLTERQEVFVKLKEIEESPEEEKKAKLLEIDEKNKEELNELRVKLENNRKEIEGRGEKIEPEILAKLQAKEAGLSKRIRVLEDFEGIKKQVFKLMSIAKKFENEKNSKYEKAKKELAEIKAKMDRASEIDKELEELDKYFEEFRKKELPTEKEALEEVKKENLENNQKYNKLIKEKEQINTEKLQANFEIADNKVKDYENGKSSEDKAINKCNLAWKMLAEGKTWDEITLVPDEEVKERQASKTEKPQEQGDEQKFDEEEVQAGVAKAVKGMMPKEDITLDRFKNRFPRLSKVPLFGKLIGGIYDKRQEKKEKIEKEEPKKVETEKEEPKKVETEKEEPKKVETEKEEPKKVETEPVKSVSQRRDQFMEYLKKMAENEHEKPSLDKIAQDMKDKYKENEKDKGEEI